MAIAQGFNHFLSWKPQTAFGTKATGLTKTIVPIRTGQTFDPQPFYENRGTVVASIGSVAQTYNKAKVLPWGCTLELINPRTANDTVRDFLRALYGREDITTISPFTKTYQIADPLIDGGTDTATVLYGRALTVHEQCDKSDGTAIFAHEAQDCVVDTMEITWEPDAPVLIRLSGQASDVQGGASDITPSSPTGSLHTWEHTKNTANSGLRIGTANPPVAADNVIFARATLRMRNAIRYAPFLGLSAGPQVRFPTRSDMVKMEFEVAVDVEDAVASQYDAADMFSHWQNKTGVNIDLLSYIGATEIFEFKASAATAAALLRQIRYETPNLGAMQAVAVFDILPAAQATDAIIKITTVDA